MSNDVVGYVVQCECGVRALTLNPHDSWMCQACTDFTGSDKWVKPDRPALKAEIAPMTIVCPDPLASAIQMYVQEHGNADGVGALVGDRFFKVIGFRAPDRERFEVSWDVDKEATETYSAPTLFVPRAADAEDDYPLGQVQG